MKSSKTECKCHCHHKEWCQNYNTNVCMAPRICEHCTPKADKEKWEKQIKQIVKSEVLKFADYMRDEEENAYDGHESGSIESIDNMFEWTERQENMLVENIHKEYLFFISELLQKELGHLIYVFEHIEPNANRERILEYIKKRLSQNNEK